MRKLILLIFIALISISAFVIGRQLYYRPGTYTPPDRELPELGLEAYTTSARLPTTDTPGLGAGVVAIDLGHRNDLSLEELNVLLAKIVTRGFSYELIASGDEEDPGLADKLRYAKALILPVPREAYTTEEIVEIERFVEKGGRLLLIGDPTRTVNVEPLNSIAGSFGIIYANDYLYSLEPESQDNNYRNVIYTHFNQSPLTEGLAEGHKIIFYSSGSISAPGHEIILADETIRSSTSEGGRTLAAAVLTTDEKVLALGDLTFFAEPYSAAENNGLFINNIADFITGGQRVFELKDFPFFFNPNVDFVFSNTRVFNSQFEDAVKLKGFLEEAERTVTFADEIDGEHDLIFIGRFDDPTAVEDYLAQARITILGPESEEELIAEQREGQEIEEANIALVSDVPPEEEEGRFIEGRIQIEGMGDLERGGATLFYLHQDQGRNILIILSQDQEANEDAFDLLLQNELSDCLLSPMVAVCQTVSPEERLPPSLRSNRIQKVLIVADDDGRARANPQTGLSAYSDALRGLYQLDTWTTSTNGSPDLDKLQAADAVIWSTGNYWDDSIGEEDVELLTNYIRAGGNLIMSGASIAFDWDHTDFLTDIAHTDYLDFAEQKDLELSLPDHPLAEDFAEGAVITFTGTTTPTLEDQTSESFNGHLAGASETEEVLKPDVVRHAPDARVIFQRGPKSAHSGAAAIIAYEDKRAKIAYFTFPIYLLPEEERGLLINNTLNWFTEKPLNPPSRSDYEPYEPSPAPEEGDEQPPDEQESGEEQQTGGEEQEGGGNSDESGGS